MNKPLLVLMLTVAIMGAALGLVSGTEPQQALPHNFVRPGLEGVYAEMRREPVMPPSTPGATRLEPRQSHYLDDRYKGQSATLDASRFNLRQIVIKFQEGAPVRLRDGVLRTVTEAATVRTRDRLDRAGLALGDLERDVTTLNQIVQKLGGTVRRAVSSIDEIDLVRLRLRAERNTRAEHSDLNLYYFVLLPGIGTQENGATLLSLRSLKSIEAAYFQPIPFDAQDRPPPTFVDVTAAQGYLRPATDGGIDVDYARRLPGGRGEDVRIADVEAGWNDTHEDLPDLAFRLGINIPPHREHGTAVLGQIAAMDNGFGATGIAPNATIGWSSVIMPDPASGAVARIFNVANAILWAGEVLREGDIVLIEQHFYSPLGDNLPPCPNNCNCGQWGYVAVETYPFEYDAISTLTAAGIIVVEAAGNGQTTVTPASSRDSGAIVVGASDVTLGPDEPVNTFKPACFTNAGPRVDVQGWGGNIGTLGYGDQDDASLRPNGPDVDQWYTRRFGGTSGASPIVVGAVALIQSTRSAMGLPRLDPFAMRTLLVSTGTPQAAGSTPHIGPMPNLRAAIQSYKPEAATTVR